MLKEKPFAGAFGKKRGKNHGGTLRRTGAIGDDIGLQEQLAHVQKELQGYGPSLQRNTHWISHFAQTARSAAAPHRTWPFSHALITALHVMTLGGKILGAANHAVWPRVVWVTRFAIRNKCIASSNKCLTTTNKRLLVNLTECSSGWLRPKSTARAPRGHVFRTRRGRRCISAVQALQVRKVLACKDKGNHLGHHPALTIHTSKWFLLSLLENRVKSQLHT